MRRYTRLLSFLLVTFLFPVFTLHAQPDCATAIATARDLLAQSGTSLDGGDPLAAATVLEQATALLRQACPEATPAPEATTPVAEATASPGPEATAAPVAETTAEATADPNAPFVNAPPVDISVPVGFVRFVHTSTDTGPLDIYAQNLGDVPLVGNLQFGQFTPFIYLPSGTYTFDARAAGAGVESEVTTSLSWDLSPDTSWLIASVGRLDNLTFLLEPVSLLRSDINGNARIRVVNWIPNIEQITVASDQGETFGEGLGWIGIHDADVAPGTYNLGLTSGDGQPLAAPAPYELAADTLTALVVAGDRDNDPAPRIIPIVSAQDVARVRFVSNRPDAVDIHVRPGNNRIVENLAPGTTTDYLPLQSGAITFVAYAPGTGPGGRELAALIDQLRPARDVTVTLNADNTIAITEVVFTPG